MLRVSCTCYWKIEFLLEIGSNDVTFLDQYFRPIFYRAQILFCLSTKMAAAKVQPLVCVVAAGDGPSRGLLGRVKYGGVLVPPGRYGRMKACLEPRTSPTNGALVKLTDYRNHWK